MEDSRTLEDELEAQLADHKETLMAIEAALVDDQNAELVQVQQELLEAVNLAEGSLLELKRARLLRELNDQAEIPSPVLKDEVVKQDKTGHPVSKPLSIEEDKINAVLGWKGEETPWTSGNKCRFRHSDGRWYVGDVILTRIKSLEEEMDRKEALVAFVHPLNSSMQLCRFFREGRCRFDNTCRFSHGVSMPVEALSAYKEVEVSSLPIGSHVLVTLRDEGDGIWQKAKLEATNLPQQYSVFLEKSGRSVEVGSESIHAFVEGEEYDQDSSNDSSCSSEEEGASTDENLLRGLGNYSFSLRFPEAGDMAKAGIQTETVNFAAWEKHTRGIASKMMASMGFKDGMGLGKEGQGISKPVEVRLLPAKMSLDFVSDKFGGLEGTSETGGTKRKRRGRGGERRRKQKQAAAVRHQKIQANEASTPDVFSFINGQLSMPVVSLSDRRETGIGSLEAEKPKNVGQKVMKKYDDDRRELLKSSHHISELTSKIAKLEDMALRNRKDRSVFAAVQKKLEESKKVLSKAQGSHANTQHLLQEKEMHKKMMKF